MNIDRLRMLLADRAVRQYRMRRLWEKELPDLDEIMEDARERYDSLHGRMSGHRGIRIPDIDYDELVEVLSDRYRDVSRGTGRLV